MGAVVNRILKGTVASTAVGTIGSGSVQAQTVNVKFGTDNTITADLIQSAGVDSNPAQGSQVFLGVSGANRMSVIATRDGIPPAANPGEYEIYSTDSPATVKKARFKCKSNGQFYMGSVTGSTDLLTVLTSLVTALNSLAASNCVNGAPLAGAPAFATAMTNLTTALNALLDNAP